MIADIIEAYREDFTKLYYAYRDLRNLQLVQRCNRVFYSNTECEYYDRDLCLRLQRNYEDLFDIYVLSKHPELSFLKNTINHPYYLAQLLSEPW